MSYTIKAAGSSTNIQSFYKFLPISSASFMLLMIFEEQ